MDNVRVRDLYGLFFCACRGSRLFFGCLAMSLMQSFQVRKIFSVSAQMISEIWWKTAEWQKKGGYRQVIRKTAL